MVIVAVAGGTGGVGKTVVEQLQLSCTKHEAFVLGRKIPAEPLPETVKFLAVDYDDVDGLAKILEEHCIDTIISTLNLENEAGSQAQLNLIAASDRSRMTRRIIPSEFVPAIDEKYSSPSCIDRLDSGALTCDDSDPQTGPGVGGWIPNALALKKSNLEYIRISIGFFADYWGMPHIQSHLRPFYWGIDMANGKAVIPGSGNDKFTVTYSEDLARFIVRLLDEKEKWPERGYLAGSDISFNELLIIAENIRGFKFDTIYDPLEKLAKGQATLLWRPEEISTEQMKALMSAHGQMIINGACHLPLEGRLNKRYPEIHLMTAEELLSQAWAGKYHKAEEVP